MSPLLISSLVYARFFCVLLFAVFNFGDSVRLARRRTRLHVDVLAASSSPTSWSRTSSLREAPCGASLRSPSCVSCKGLALCRRPSGPQGLGHPRRLLRSWPPAPRHDDAALRHLPRRHHGPLRCGRRATRCPSWSSSHAEDRRPAECGLCESSWCRPGRWTSRRSSGPPVRGPRRASTW